MLGHISFVLAVSIRHITVVVIFLSGVKFEAGDIEAVLTTFVNSASLTALDRQIGYQFIQWIVSVL